MNSPRTFSSRSRSAFSLVEILFTVAIVAILAGLSLSKIQPLIKKSQQTQSMGNLRQIHIGLSAYATDNNGCYPALAGNGWVAKYWTQELTPYLGPANTNASIYVRTPPAYVSQVFLSPLVSKGAHHFYGDYGANQEVIRYSGYANSTGNSEPLRVASITNASRVVAVMEAQFRLNGVDIGSWYIETNTYVSTSNGNVSPATQQPSDRGIGHIISLFCDGHVDSIKKEDFVSNRRQYLLLNP